MGTGLRTPDKMAPLLNKRLPRLVRWMSLAGNDELHRALRIAQQAKQSFRIVQQQVWSFICRETPCKAEC